MHEASIAQSIIEITHQVRPPQMEGKVKSVRIKIGECAGIEIESLRFCFEALTTGTDLNGTILEIEHVPFRISCRQCGQITRTEFGTMACGGCDSTDTAVVSGQEMQITEIELSDEEVQA